MKVRCGEYKGELVQISVPIKNLDYGDGDKGEGGKVVINGYDIIIKQNDGAKILLENVELSDISPVANCVLCKYCIKYRTEINDGKKNIPRIYSYCLYENLGSTMMKEPREDSFNANCSCMIYKERTKKDEKQGEVIKRIIEDGYLSSACGVWKLPLKMAEEIRKECVENYAGI